MVSGRQDKSQEAIKHQEAVLLHPNKMMLRCTLNLFRQRYREAIIDSKAEKKKEASISYFALFRSSFSTSRR